MNLGLISTDFDGTLFADYDQPSIPPRVETIIGSLQRRGAKWVINTGRDLTSLMQGLQRAQLRIHPDFLVLVEREIYAREGAGYVGLEPWNSRCADSHRKLFALVSPDVPRLAAWVNARFRATVYEDAYSPFCLIAESTGDAEAIHEFLDVYCKGVPGLVVVRNEVYMRFSHAEFNKGTALAELRQRLGLETDAVFAAGDHLNDLAMLDPIHARWLAAPANAIPHVKSRVISHGGHVSTLSNGHGIAEALELLAERLSQAGMAQMPKAGLLP